MSLQTRAPIDEAFIQAALAADAEWRVSGDDDLLMRPKSDPFESARRGRHWISGRAEVTPP
jgi:predicted nucleic acid-binding protein